MRTWAILALMATLFFLGTSAYFLFFVDQDRIGSSVADSPRADYAVSYDYAAIALAYCFAVAVFAFRLIWGKKRVKMRRRVDLLDDNL